MTHSAHVDRFVRDHLPPPGQWPELCFDTPELRYPERLNAAAELLDGMAGGPHAERRALCAPGEAGPLAWSYRELAACANRIAHVLRDTLGLVPGNRVLLRGPNQPMLAACWLAVVKAGGVAVGTMPLLRARELAHVIEKARVGLALCDARLVDELRAAAGRGSHLKAIRCFNGEGADALEPLLAAQPASFEPVDTAADDPALIAFTSGTTGPPKAAVHFHRDVLAMCDAWPRSVVGLRPDDICCGTPPLAFTYGLGVMLCAPLRAGACAVLTEKVTPAGLLQTIQDFRGTLVATVPTFLAQMAPLAHRYDLSSLRAVISSGEALLDATRDRLRQAFGLEPIDGIGATEMMQTFISHTPERARRGAVGYVIPGYRARVVDAGGRPCPPGVVGQLAVKGASGCLYLDDPRQRDYVRDGWNLTGDAFRMDADGYFYFHGRADDLIVSSGYNIGGVEVESALLEHPAVAECAVVGTPDPQRGQAVTAFVVLRPGYEAGESRVAELQDFVKASIAPYKYPRRVEFLDALPRGPTGKLLRSRLRARQPEDPASP